MIHFIEDAKELAPFFACDDIYDSISDDFRDEAIRDSLADIFVRSPAILPLMVDEHTAYLLTIKSKIWFEVHTMILPEGRGRKGIKAGKRGIDWIFQHTECQKLTSLVPEFNKQANYYARLCGFIVEGICTKSFMKNGILHDQTMFGRERS